MANTSEIVEPTECPLAVDTVGQVRFGHVMTPPSWMSRLTASFYKFSHSFLVIGALLKSVT